MQVGRAIFIVESLWNPDRSPSLPSKPEVTRAPATSIHRSSILRISGPRNSFGTCLSLQYHPQSFGYANLPDALFKDVRLQEVLQVHNDGQLRSELLVG